jgi:hypothetical protein
MLSWVLDEASRSPKRCGVDAVTRRILTFNFAGESESHSNVQETNLS